MDGINRNGECPVMPNKKKSAPAATNRRMIMERFFPTRVLKNKKPAGWFSFLCLFFFNASFAASPDTIPLWTGTPPGALGNQEKDTPTLTVYLPEGTDTLAAAVVICPGGGYRMLAMDKEGHEIAKYLNTLGVAGVVLKYRLPADGYRHPVPLWDALRAIRTVRANAGKWRVDPNRVGIMGFSAGGHLASTAGTHFKTERDGSLDAVDRLAARPDYMILIYPVISTTRYVHTGSRDNLLGPCPDSALVASVSNERRVTSETPPAFLVHSDDDKAVPPENSVLFYLAMQAAGVPAELHVFPTGGHGFGIAKNTSTASQTWHLRLAEWMRANRFVD